MRHDSFECDLCGRTGMLPPGWLEVESYVHACDRCIERDGTFSRLWDLFTRRKLRIA